MPEPEQTLICTVCGTEWIETPGSDAPCDCGGELKPNPQPE